MSYDSPVELESALNPCYSHGNWEGGGGGGGGEGGAASALLFLPCVFNSVSFWNEVKKKKNIIIFKKAHTDLVCVLLIE